MRSMLALCVLTASVAVGTVTASASNLPRGLAVEITHGCVAPPKYSRAPHRPFNVSDAGVYRESCTVARLAGPRRMARDYRVRSTNPLTICEAYARISFRPVLFRPAIDGCLKGFRLR